MTMDRLTPDASYHQRRAEQERHLARRARTVVARDCHIALMRLHESRRDGAFAPG